MIRHIIISAGNKDWRVTVEEAKEMYKSLGELFGEKECPKAIQISGLSPKQQDKYFKELAEDMMKHGDL